MANLKKQGLTRLELKLMQALWRLGTGTVAEVQQQIEPVPAYTTVQTILNILERKGKLTRVLEGRAYRYEPAITESKALGAAVRDMVERMFGGSGEELVMSLVRNQQIDSKTLADLARRLQKEGEV